jgi:predicted O-methyltransferase YrrM
LPTFTQDWFSHNVPNLQKALGLLEKRRRFLEIGCFEGMSTCWFLRNALDDVGEIVCVDTFEGGIEHVKTSFEGVRERFEQNIAEMKGPAQSVRVLDCHSHLALAKLISEESRFDFIYVDGSHTAPDVLADACLAYLLLQTGGIIVFDDYLYGQDKPLLETPKAALDMFTLLYREKVSIVMLNYQLGVRKIG